MGRARSRSARAPCGSSTATTERCRESTPPRTRSTWIGRVGSDPTAVAVGEGAVWVAGGEEGTVARVDADGPRGHREAEDRQQPGGDRGRGRLGVGGGRRAAGRAPRRDAAAARPARAAGLGSHGLAALAGLHHLGDAPSSARWPTTVWSPTGASRAPPARRSSARSPRACRTEPRRPELRLHAATRAALLRRKAGPPDGLPGLDGALAGGDARPSPGEAVPAVLRGDRRRSAVHGRSRPLRPLARDRDRSARAHHHHPPDPPGRGLPAQARDALRVRRARRQPPPRHDRSRRHPGTGPYRVIAWDATARRDTGPQPVLRIDPGSLARRGLRGPHRDPCARRQLDANERQIADVQRGAADVAVIANPFDSPGLAGPAARAARALAGPDAQQAGAGRGLDVPQRAAAAVRRQPRAACGQLRDRPRRESSSSRAGAEVGAAHLPARARRVPGLPALLPVHRGPHDERGLERAGHGARAQARGGVRPGR